MRKMMNKKGFSLVELMIVVVIMGILIAVAIPLYGAITENANNKTCATNIETIKSTAANYYASYDQTAMKDYADLAEFMDDGKVPVCPLAEAEDGTDDYEVYIQSNGSAKVYCPQINAEDENGDLADANAEPHNPEGAEAAQLSSGELEGSVANGVATRKS